jgi:DNA-directed RNA polymerase specialized sigma subunit
LELKELIAKAKEKDVKAMEELLTRFTPLLKSRAKRYSRIGLEYEEVFQQAALIFILAVYDYKERPPTTFAGYIQKRIDWGLWAYYRKYLKQQIEISYGLNPKNPHR